MSRKHVRKPPAGKNNHHYWFPKKLYSWNKIFYDIDKQFHTDFHSYFFKHCRPANRICHPQCLYKGICCYRDSGIAFGKFIPWAEGE